MKRLLLDKTCMLIVSLVTAFSIPATSSFALDAQAEAATRKVNLAGRQRMLSQRMSMAACYMTINVEHDKHLGILREAYEEFVKVHHGLLHGDEEIGLEAEGYRHVVDALNVVDGEWMEYQEILEGFISIQLMSRNAFHNMNVDGLSVLNEMNIAVSQITTSYSADLELLPEILALSIDFAGRQRMLTQKMSKEYCLIQAGIDVDENMENLNQSQAQFNATLNALIDGVPHVIVAAPTPEIRAQLEEVRVLWEHPHNALASAAAGNEIQLHESDVIVHEMDAVLHAMNDAVKMYESVHGLKDY